MAHVVISPHLDDAVLSCHMLLTQPRRFREFGGADGSWPDDVDVVNLFSGLPPRDMRAPWDRQCGVLSSWAFVHTRIGEDAEIMAALGVRSHYLDELDSQYRPENFEPDLELIVQGILDAVEVDETSTLWIPWGRYDSGRRTHPDHLLARTAAELLAEETGCIRRYYADLPYLHESTLVDDSAHVTVTTVRAERRKLRVCRRYETQWRHLDTKWKRLRTERYIKLESTPADTAPRSAS